LKEEQRKKERRWREEQRKKEGEGKSRGLKLKKKKIRIKKLFLPRNLRSNPLHKETNFHRRRDLNVEMASIMLRWDWDRWVLRSERKIDCFTQKRRKRKDQEQTLKKIKL
jgi:hypothetical protein